MVRLLLLLLLVLVSGSVQAATIPAKYSTPTWTGAESCTGAAGPIGWYSDRDSAKGVWLAGITVSGARCSNPTCFYFDAWEAGSGLVGRYHQQWCSNGAAWAQGYFTLGAGCPDGGTLSGASYPYSCINAPEVCEQPPSPCEMYVGTDSREVAKKTKCLLQLVWDAEDCDYKHADGCGSGSGEDSGPFGGYYPASSGKTLGQTVCAYGCQYIVDQNVPTTNQVHVTLSGKECSDIPPPPNENYDDEKTSTDDTEVQPDNDSDDKTNCGTINGEYICIDSIPNGTCVSSPNGAIVCVSPPEATPDVPVPVSPSITIYAPGPNPSDPSDDDRMDYYKDPKQPECPTGFLYVKGQCVRIPTGDGTCPEGSTNYNDMCVWNSDPGGPFSGPKMTFTPPAGPPECTYSSSFTGFYNQVITAPIAQFIPQCGSSGGSACPTFSVFGYSTRIHCELAEMAVPLFGTFLWLIAGIIAIRTVLSS